MKPPPFLPGASVRKESACSAGDQGLIPGSRRSPGEGNGNPLQYSCLGNSMDRGAWWATAHKVIKVGHNLGEWLLIKKKKSSPSPGKELYLAIEWVLSFPRILTIQSIFKIHIDYQESVGVLF